MAFLSQKQVADGHTTTPSRTRPRIILTLSALLILGGLLTFVVPAWKVGSNSGARAELVLELPISGNSIGGVIRGGRLYHSTDSQAADKPKDVTLSITTLTDQKTVPLNRVNIEGQVVDQTLVTDSEILMVTRPAPLPTPPPTPPPPGRANSRSNNPLAGVSFPAHLPLRTQTEPPAPLPPGQRRVSMKRWITREPRPTMLHRIPLNGGPVRTNPIDTQGYSLGDGPHILTSEGLFWILPRAASYAYVVEKKQVLYQETPLDDLMVSPLDGGKARVWRRGVSGYYMTTTPDSDNFLLRGRVRGGNEDKDTFYLISRTDARAVPFPPPQRIGMKIPVVFGDCLYWIETHVQVDSEAREITPDTPMTGRVLRCRRDGSNQQVVWDGRDEAGEITLPGPLFVYQGRLYIVYAPSRLIVQGNGYTRAGTPPDQGYRVARFYPDRPHPLGASCRLAPGMDSDVREYGSSGSLLSERVHVDDGYLYAFVPELRTRPLDFLSRNSTANGVICLYRVRLPE